MMMIKRIILAATFFIFAGSINAQQAGKAPSSSSYSTYKPSKSSFSLLDLSRFHMTQSYSFAYTSSKTGSNSLGMYLNSIEYQISDPLQIRLDIAYVHNPIGILNNGSGSITNGRILPGVSINWQPTKNMFFHFSYRQAPVYFNYDFPESNRQHYTKEEGH